MSVWKGSNMIAATVPGPAGQNGTNGTNGQGIMLRADFNELHNNINANGNIEITNDAGFSTWCSVGGYRCTISGGQGSIVYGYDCAGSGSGTAVFGYRNNGGSLGLGTLVEGYDNSVTETAQGTHIEGWSNELGNMLSGGRGVHIEGAEHTFVKVSADGGHQGGCGITANTPMLKLPHEKPGTYQTTILEAIGLPSRIPDGEYARIVRADGSMAINGDMSFMATKADGSPETDTNHPDGIYTLGEIVKALHDAGITIPVHTR